MAQNPAHLLARDPDLAAVAEAWPRLPERVRRAVLAMVDAARDG